MKRLAMALVLLAVFGLTRAEAVPVHDQQGRTVTLPGKVSKVLGASAPVTFLVYSIDPSLLVGLNLPPDEAQRRFLRPETMKLPVIGGFGGQGRNFNPEVLLAARPDLVLAWGPAPKGLNPRAEKTLASSGIPYLFLTLDRMSDYPAAYEYLGAILGRPERARMLANYFRKEVKKLERFSARIPARQRVPVYFAEEADGLTTVSAGSVHGEAVQLAGGRNVHRGASGGGRFKEKISLEQVLAYDPEVIIAQDETFFERVYRDPRWSGIRAVRNRRVYLIPDAPFEWMDRPPTFLRLLGAKWLASVLYPRSYRADLSADTREFYQLFFKVNLDSGEVRKILHQK
ncbi:ABC transporter substrate-binding protein [Geomesophilobacter sediminis]|uniref:ABC transporter substrate-binding protein n=1 Tax=Geomesophilobacter sediminis TaxID=2798584 RepID=A0A8J7LVI4_9BACT|nr:ABC transporter substrate-binding protein [Geomesophilobacter sediminis]MBJ6725065.1 ABC transporter substrate-binding protein [Geomesophilobacter sediminis]